MPIVPIANYGKRTGVTTLKKLVLALCDLYNKYKPSIDAWIDANVDFPTNVTVKANLADMQVACNIIRIIPDD